MCGSRVLLYLPPLVYWVTLVYWVALVSCYADMDDTVNFDTLIRNRTAMKTYLDCFMNKGQCDYTQLHFKIHLKEAFANKCNFCDEIQKRDGRVFMIAIRKEFPKQAKEYFKMYDPDGSYEKLLVDGPQK